MNSVCLRVSLRAAAVELVATGALLGLAHLLRPSVDLDPDQPFAALLGQWCGVVLLGCAGWLWVVTGLVLLEAVRARPAVPLRARRAAIPAAYRRLVLGACGLALTAGVAAPALATPGPVHLDPRPAAASAPAVPARAPLQLRPPDQVARHLGTGIVVRPGDSLWHLAAERLPHDTDDATIGHTWRRLYAANERLIGDDPDHIEPGQRLERPRSW